MRGLRRQINDLQATLNNSLAGLVASLSFPADQFQPNYCFMPSVSTLDIRNTNNPNEWNWYSNPNILGTNLFGLNLKNTNLIPFFDFYAPEKNLRHVEVDEKMRLWVKQYMIDTDKDGLTLPKILPSNGFSSYNYSYRKNRISTVTINANGILKVNEIGNSAYNYTKNLEKENYDVQLGGDCGTTVVTVNGGSFWLGSPTEAKRNAILSIGVGNKVIVSSGNLDLYNRSRIVIMDGGELIVKNDGIVNMRNNTQIVVKPNGKLTIQAGANFNLIDYAEIVVEQGGTLNIENGSNPVVFNGAAGWGNPIKILGLLSVGSPVQFRGGAYFDFHQGHTLTLNSTFHVTGDGNKMINLQEYVALFLKNQDVNWNSGRVQYKNNTRVVMPSEKNANFTGVAFEGNSKGGGMIGLINNNKVAPTTLNLESCTFNHLDICISLISEDIRKSPESFTLSYTDFNEYRTIGILGKQGKTMLANYCMFKTSMPFVHLKQELDDFTPSKTPPAMALYDFGSGDKPSVVLSECTIFGNRAEDFRKWYDGVGQPKASYTGILDNDPFIREEYGYEVYLKNVPNFITYGTVIQDAFNAILAEQNTNINLLSGTRLVDNGIGIKMGGDFADDPTRATASGRLTMDCASFINNVIGATGRNIWLNIDEYINSQGHNTNTFAQYFGSKDVGRFFDISYEWKANQILQSLYPSNTIAATFNRWQPNLPQDMVDYFFSVKGGQQLSLNFFPVNFSPDDICETLKEKTYDDSDFGDVADDKAKGALVINGTYQPVMPLFWTGFSSYLAGNIPQAQKILAPLSAIPYEEKGEIENPYIQQMIDVAKTIVYASGKDGDIIIKSKIQKTPTSNIKIYPNPATDRINISLPKGNFDISIMDNQGRNVFKMNSESETTVNTSNWLSGIYHVLLRNTATGEQSVQKVVVMKMD